jgi:phosphoglycerate dehydrogenase-like enzyme
MTTGPVVVVADANLAPLRAEFEAALPPGAPVVDQAALYAALHDRVIAGAAIDVWYDYPTGDNGAAPSPIACSALPNVLMTPHSSGSTRQTFTGRAADIAANVGRLVAGESLRNVVAVAR